MVDGWFSNIYFISQSSSTRKIYEEVLILSVLFYKTNIVTKLIKVTEISLHDPAHLEESLEVVNLAEGHGH